MDLDPDLEGIFSLDVILLFNLILIIFKHNLLAKPIMQYSKIIIILLLSTFLSSSISAQYKSQNKKLDDMIIQGMEDWEIPGLAALVVKDGKVVFQKTYGVKDIETKEAVDANTLFNMASTTKAMIAISIGILVDRGMVSWDDKVQDYLPYFKLSDAYIANDARVKDLLTHNLGIGNADLLWILDSLSTKETLAKFKYAKTTYPLRGGFTYQNIMYAAAGELIEAVSGKHWTTFVEENIFKPLDMTRSVTKSVDILKKGNITTPHYNDIEDGLVKVGYTFSDQIGAAGMIWSSISDISHYMNFLIDDGVYHGDTLIQSSTFKYLFKPHSFVSKNEFYPTQKLTKPNWTTYGLGWFQHDYRGDKLDFHTGSISGLVAIAGIMHKHNVAVYVFANLDHAELRHAIMYKAMDLYAFDDDKRDWHKEIFNMYSSFREQTILALKKQKDGRIKGTSPTLDLEEYTGTYEHEMLGNAVVSLKEGKLHIDFNNYISYILEHWHYDTFKTNKDPKWHFSSLISFDQDKSGKISDLEVFEEKFIKIKNTIE
jgi:CubicO group peptidase (beta-lactamase class C family)